MVGIKIPAMPFVTAVVFTDIGTISCYVIRHQQPLNGQFVFPFSATGLPVTYVPPSEGFPSYSILHTDDLPFQPPELPGEVECYPQRPMSESDSFDHRSVRVVHVLLSSDAIKHLGLQQWNVLPRIDYEGGSVADNSADLLITGGVPSTLRDEPETRELAPNMGVVVQWREPTLTSMRDLLILTEGTLFAVLANLLLEFGKVWTERQAPESPPPTDAA